MSDKGFAVCCKGCGHIEDKAWKAATATEHSKRSDEPLTLRGQVPVYCQKCGARNWEVPASQKSIDAFEEKQRREARAVELTAREDFDGLFKIPEELRAAPEVKRALSNLLGPLDGEVLKAAQRNILTVARSGIAADSIAWIDYYDKAVAKALPAGKAKSAA